MGEGPGSSVEVACTGGLVSDKCTTSIDVQVSDTRALLEALESIWSRDPERPVLLVTPSFRGFDALLEELEEMSRNPFLVEATGVPETILTGLSVEELIDYWIGMLRLTMRERVSARRRSPRVSRRELLRRLFLVPPRYVILPRARSTSVACGGICPFEALGEGRLDEDKCEGCMLCTWLCPGGFEPPSWAGPSSLLYAYRFIDKYGLDGILFICRRMLGALDTAAVEASPARLAPFHIPCVSWLNPRLLQALARLGVYVHVYAGEEACSGCRLEKAVTRALEALKEAGVTIATNLASAGSAAFTGYTRPRRSLEEVAGILASELERQRRAL